MDFHDLIKTRYSVRKYSRRKIPRDLIDKCLEAARMAPSASNSQPWYFIVVDDPEVKEKLARQAVTGIYRLNTFVGEAPVLIIVTIRKSKVITRVGSAIMNIKYNLIDIGIASDHLILQAAELGIGTCMLGWFNEKKIKGILKLPRSVKIGMVISMGYPMDSSKKEKNRKPLADIRDYV